MLQRTPASSLHGSRTVEVLYMHDAEIFLVNTTCLKKSGKVEILSTGFLQCEIHTAYVISDIKMSGI